MILDSGRIFVGIPAETLVCGGVLEPVEVLMILGPPAMMPTVWLWPAELTAELQVSLSTSKWVPEMGGRTKQQCRTPSPGTQTAEPVSVPTFCDSEQNLVGGTD